METIWVSGVSGVGFRDIVQGVHRGYYILGDYYYHAIVFWGHTWIMEKKMETARV